MKAAIIYVGSQLAQCDQAPLRVREVSRTEPGETFELNPKGRGFPSGLPSHQRDRQHHSPVGAAPATSTNARQAA